MVRARCGDDGLVSVRTCVDLQVENCAAILSPYDGQHTADSHVGCGAEPDRDINPWRRVWMQAT
ncbi:hypothetical protein J6590_052739 [Homalodisca vitripennis]|nr:hypothetical protein J6590_052739 [Homalodisca vitripennis]